MLELITRILPLIVVLGVIFGLVGGTMAFIIIYAEYKKHLISNSRVIRESLGAGVTAFLVLLLGALIIGLVISVFSR